MQGKIYKLRELELKLPLVRGDKSVGIITGSFDILRPGHLKLFKFAKDSVDIVIVGIDSDIAIKKTKGSSRPVTKQEDRARILSSIPQIDYVLLLTSTHEFTTTDSSWYHDSVVLRLKPTHLITNSGSDPYWRLKEGRIKKVGGKILLHK